MNIKVILWQEDDLWCATVPAFPGCHTWGESYEHLMAMVKGQKVACYFNVQLS